MIDKKKKINKMAGKLYAVYGFVSVGAADDHDFSTSQSSRERLMYDLAKESFKYWNSIFKEEKRK